MERPINKLLECGAAIWSVTITFLSYPLTISIHGSGKEILISDL